jgi:hypothetical protein
MGSCSFNRTITLTVAQILELLDKNQLGREGIRALAEAQKK